MKKSINLLAIVCVIVSMGIVCGNALENMDEIISEENIEVESTEIEGSVILSTGVGCSFRSNADEG